MSYERHVPTSGVIFDPSFGGGTTTLIVRLLAPSSSFRIDKSRGSDTGARPITSQLGVEMYDHSVTQSAQTVDSQLTTSPFASCSWYW